MKRKILLFSLLFALLLSVLPIAAAAEEGLPEGPAETETADEPCEGGTDEPCDNLFAVLFDKIGASLGEIFAGVAAIASLLIVFTYKKGFLPLLSGAFERLNGTVKNAEEGAKAQTDAAKKLAEDLKNRFENAQSALEKCNVLLAEYAEKLPAVEAQKGDSAVLRTVLLGQIGLLEDVFMASSLPQYRKDEIGERVAAMKAAICPEVSADDGQKDR